MLNERREIKELLGGKRFNKDSMYRSVYLLAQHFKEQGHDQSSCIKEIFQWGKTNHIAIPDSVKFATRRAFEENKDIVEDVEIKFYKEDIEMINDCAFYVKGMHKPSKNYNLRLVMFAIMAYHKANKDKDDICEMSIIGLSNWVEIARQNLHNRYLGKVYESQFVKKINNIDPYIGLKTLRKKHKMITKNNKFYIKYPEYKNKDDYFIFKDRDLKYEFDLINEHF